MARLRKKKEQQQQKPLKKAKDGRVAKQPKAKPQAKPPAQPVLPKPDGRRDCRTLILKPFSQAMALDRSDGGRISKKEASARLQVKLDALRALHPDIERVNVPRQCRVQDGGRVGLKHCFVQFATEAQCRLAKDQLQGRDFLGGPLKVDQVGQGSKFGGNFSADASPAGGPRKLVVSNLPPGLSRRLLRKLFPGSQHAKISTRRVNTGLVFFETPDLAQTALKDSTNLVLSGKKLLVRFLIAPNTTLCVKNLPKAMDHQAVRQLFPTSNFAKVRKGTAYVYFANSDLAKAVLDDSADMSVNGQKLVISERKRKKGKSTEAKAPEKDKEENRPVSESVKKESEDDDGDEELANDEESGEEDEGVVSGEESGEEDEKLTNDGESEEEDEEELANDEESDDEELANDEESEEEDDEKMADEEESEDENEN